jgi:hypothetical protein
MTSKDSIYVFYQRRGNYEYAFMLEANTNRTEATIISAKRKLPTAAIKTWDDIDDYVGGDVMVEYKPLKQEDLENAGPGQMELYMKHHQGDLKVLQRYGIISKGDRLYQLYYLPSNEKKIYKKIFSGRPTVS